MIMVPNVVVIPNSKLSYRGENIDAKAASLEKCDMTFKLFHALA